MNAQRRPPNAESPGVYKSLRRHAIVIALTAAGVGAGTRVALEGSARLPQPGVPQPPQLTLERFEGVEPHMGTLVRITLYAPDVAAARVAFRAGFDRIRELNGILSDYLPDSELSRVTRAGVDSPVSLSDDLFAVLKASARLSDATDGAFDVTQGPVTRLWREARTANRLPDPDALREASRRSGYAHMHLDEARRTVSFDIPGMQLDVGAIGKGYAASEALAAITRAGVRSALVAVSGDIAVGDAPPGQPGWRIRIHDGDIGDPTIPPILRLTRAAVSTSGNAEQHLDVGGRRYSHVIDPASGTGLLDDITVTVVARHGIDADGLDTAIGVLGVSRGLALIERDTEAAALIVLRKGGTATAHASVRLRRIIAAQPSGVGPSRSRPCQQGIDLGARGQRGLRARARDGQRARRVAHPQGLRVRAPLRKRDGEGAHERVTGRCRIGRDHGMRLDLRDGAVARHEPRASGPERDDNRAGPPGAQRRQRLAGLVRGGPRNGDELRLVHHEVVDSGDEGIGDCGGRCRVEDDGATGFSGNPCGGFHGFERHLELEQHHVRGLDHVTSRLDVGRRQRTVGAGDDDNRVLAGSVHSDERHARRRLRPRRDVADVDPLARETLPHDEAEGIVTDPADHRHFAAQPLRRHRLVGALATWHCQERVAREGLTRPGKARGPHDEIHVEAADDGDAGHG